MGSNPTGGTNCIDTTAFFLVSGRFVEPLGDLIDLVDGVGGQGDGDVRLGVVDDVDGELGGFEQLP